MLLSSSDHQGDHFSDPVEHFNDQSEQFHDELEVPEDLLTQEEEEKPLNQSVTCSPFQRAVQSTQEMRDMFTWWMKQSTPNSDDDSSSSDEDSNEVEEVPIEETASQQQQPQRSNFRDDMVKRWRQKRVVPGFYGLVMYNNEVKSMEEGFPTTNKATTTTPPCKDQDVFLARFRSTKGGGGFYEKRSHGTCVTEAMTEFSGYSNDTTSDNEIPSAAQYETTCKQIIESPSGQVSTATEDLSSETTASRADDDEEHYHPDEIHHTHKMFRPIDEDELHDVALHDRDIVNVETTKKPVKKQYGEKWTFKKKVAVFGMIFLTVGLILVLVWWIFGPDDENSNNSNNEDDLKALLSEVALEGGVEFDDPTSYQSKALTWLLSDSHLDQYSDQQTIQRWVLACIYFSTNKIHEWNTEWIASDKWLSNDKHECDWMGISCNDDNVKAVVEIQLRNNRLTGVFPAEVSLLASSLESLDLNTNFLINEGRKGHMFLEQLTNLHRLDLGSNYFMSDEGVPLQLQGLTNLIELDVSDVRYRGALQGQVFSNMQVLQDLRLGGNEYNSSIPLEIGNLASLEYLHIENAGITGDLRFMEPMENIFEVWLDQNPSLGGTLPSFVGEIDSLVSVSISKCNLTGTIPTKLGLLEDLQLLWLNDNALTGQVPSELGNLDKLRRLDIKDNALTGQVPMEICSNRQPPNGVLAVLEADCRSEIQCSCCSQCF